MAIYHAHVSSGSRKGGQSGAAKVAYVLREGKYSGRYDLVVSGFGNLPTWAGGDPRALFTAADLYERANARLFVEVEVALPNELAEPQQQELVRAIAAAVTTPGLPFTYAIHAGRPKSIGEPANPHAHILLSERVNDGIPRDAAQWFRRANKKAPELGGAAKDRSVKERSWVEDTRKVIEALINEHLTRSELAERVTADSHATRIKKALAGGDIETAKFLRQHPPGLHLGPTVAALERDRFRQKEGEPVLSREGEATERGDRLRGIAGETERLAKGMEVDAEALGHARTDLERAEKAVAAARSAGLADEAVLRIYETSKSSESGSGWRAVEAATASLVDRKAVAEAAAEQLQVDVAAVYRSARDRGAEPVADLEEAIVVFSSARSALLPGVEAWRIHDAAESVEQGTGWAAVKEASSSRQARRAAAEAKAAEFDLDINDVYGLARERDADPVVELERSVDEAERQASARRRAEAQRRAALEEREGSVAATPQGSTWLLAAQEEARGRSGGQLTLEERESIVDAVYQRVDEDLARREETLRSMSTGTQHLSAAVGKLFGEEKQARTLADRESMIGEAERRVEEELLGREEALRLVPLGAQYLSEAAQEGRGDGNRAAVLAARDVIVTTAEKRLERELDSREQALVSSAGSEGLLVEAFSELCGGDASFGDGSSLPERWQIITLAEQWHGEDRAEDAERSVALDALEALLKETSSGAQQLGAAQQEVLGGVGKDLAPLDQREMAVRMAMLAVERELDRHEAAVCRKAGGETLLSKLKSELVEDGSSACRKAGGETLPKSELVEDGSSALTLVEREKLIATAEQQLRKQRRTKLFQYRDGKSLYDGKLDQLERETGRALDKHVDQALDHGEAALQTAERERQFDAGLVALRKRQCEGVTVGGGEWFYTRKLAELERGQQQSSPERREQALDWAERQMNRLDSLRVEDALDLFLRKLNEFSAARRPGDIEVALDYAWTQLAALNRDIERRRVDIHGTPGDGYARLLRAGFESKSRQRKVQALTTVETYLNEAAVAERKRRATKQRVARVKRLFVAPFGDKALFASLDARQPTWRERETGSADIDIALDRAEQRVDRTQPTTAEHEVVVDAEQTFVTASSSVWRQAGERFPEGSTQARSVSRRLSDRARVRALVAEREESPASPELVKRVFDWLQAQVEKLLQRLGLVKPVTRQSAPASGASRPSPPVSTDRLPSRPLSLEEREPVASTVERVIAEMGAKIGFAPPVPVWRTVGSKFRGRFDPESRPGLLVSTLEALPEGTVGAPADEEQTLRPALDEQRHAENDQRHQRALEKYQQALETWKEAGGSWFRNPGWAKPTEPPKPELAPPTQEQIDEFRWQFINQMESFVREWIERKFDLDERARPLRPGEGVPARPSVTVRVSPERNRGLDDDYGPSR